MPPVVARIITDIALDREFDYLVPPEWQGRVQIGSVVRVPFGPRHVRGFVTGLTDHSTFPKLKAIESVTGDLPLFDDQMLRLARWVADYYAAPFESAIAAMEREIDETIQVSVKRAAEAPIPEPARLHAGVFHAKA